MGKRPVDTVHRHDKNHRHCPSNCISPYLVPRPSHPYCTNDRWHRVGGWAARRTIGVEFCTFCVTCFYRSTVVTCCLRVLVNLCTSLTNLANLLGGHPHTEPRFIIKGSEAGQARPAGCCLGAELNKLTFTTHPFDPVHAGSIGGLKTYGCAQQAAPPEADLFPVLIKVVCVHRQAIAYGFTHLGPGQLPAHPPPPIQEYFLQGKNEILLKRLEIGDQF